MKSIHTYPLQKQKIIILFWVCSVLMISSCHDEPIPDPIDDSLTHIAYDPEPYQLEYKDYVLQILPTFFSIPEMYIPADNPMTIQGVDLGRHLFFDNILSGDSTMSCASCHLPELAFTDGKAVSLGIDNIPGKRSSMSLLNIGLIDNGFFWDGRVNSLEEQALLPVEDPIELHANWEDVVQKLKENTIYPEKFRKAFGIESKSDITKELAAKALAQFERSIFSFESKFDKYLRGETVLSDDELYGLEMYIDGPDAPDAQCAHCHNLPLMSSNDYFNNGLQDAPSLEDFKDIGYGKVLGKSKNGFFKAPSLRNIALTAPYMHDGSLSTLEEVIDHYTSGGKPSINKDPLLDDIDLSEDDKKALIAFLHTLTDDIVIQREDLKNPFK